VLRVAILRGVYLISYYPQPGVAGTKQA
jgi:hypothetical protein